MNQHRHRLDLRIALFAALALIVAQMGAMTHAYSHAPKAAPLSGQLPAPIDHQVCGECLNFAPLLATAGAPVTAAYVEPPAPALSTRSAAASRLARPPLLAFRSRAPPPTR